MKHNTKEIVQMLLQQDTLADGASAMEMLYHYYRTANVVDTKEIRENFFQLDEVLGKLTLKECDKVWDLTCALCSEHEKHGFMEGVRVGASLAVELASEEHL